MAKRIDLFKINILGIDELLDQYNDLESKLKAVDSLILKHNKTIQDYHSLVNAGVEVTEKQTEAFNASAKAIPELTNQRKKYAQSFNEIINKIDEEREKQERTLEENKRIAKEREIAAKALAAAEKQAAKEALQAEKLAVKERNDIANEITRQRKKNEDAAEKQSIKEKSLQNDLSLQVRSIEDLARKTNALISVRKKLDLTSVDGRTEFDRLTKEILKNTDQIKAYDAQIGSHVRNVGNYSSAVSGLFTTWAKGAAIIAGATKTIEYAVKVIGDETEGVEQAFARLNDPKILDRLKEATKGTVSELTLMKSAVRADNFKIPLDALAKGLQFAQQRARDTGESVDYLVNSFVTGIGRKSIMILDNLGISSTSLKEKIGDVGIQSLSTAELAKALGEVIDEEMAKVSDSTTLAAIKAGRLRAAWQNIQDQARKGIANFFAPLAEKGEIALNWINKNTESIKTFFSVLAIATATVYAYIAALKVKVIWQNLTTRSTQANAAALATETVAQIANTRGQVAATSSTKLLAAAKLLLTGNIKAATAAFRLFTVSLMANPVGLVLGAITALVGIIYLLSDSTTEQERAQKRLNDRMAEAKQRKDELTNTSSSLLSILNDETKTLLDQVVAYRELQNMFPKLLKNMDMQTFKTLSAAEQQKLLNQAMSEMDDAFNSKELEKQQKTILDIQNQIVEKKAAISKADADTVLSQYHALGKLEERLEAEQGVLDELIKQNEEREAAKKQAEFEALPQNEKLKILNEQLVTLEAQKTKIEDIANKSVGLGSAFEDFAQKAKDVLFQMAGIDDQISKIRNQINAILGKDASLDTESRIEEQIRRLTALRKEAKLGSDEWKEYNRQIELLNKHLPKNNNNSSVKSEENAVKKRADIIYNNNKLIEKLIADSERIEIEQQAESIEKKLALQKESDKKELLQLKQGIDDRKKAVEDYYKDQQKRTGKKASDSEIDNSISSINSAYENNENAIIQRSYNEKKKILDSYTIDEVRAYQERLKNSKEFNQEDLRLSEKVINEKLQIQEQKLNADIEKERFKLKTNYESEKEIINATISDQTKKNQEIAKLDLSNAQDRFALLRKEMELRRANSTLTEQDLEDYKNKLKEIYNEIEILSQNTDRQTPLAKMLGLDDEQAELLKDKAIQLATDINNTIANIQLERNQQWLSAEIKRLDEAKESELKSLESKNKQGIINENDYNKKKEEVEDKYEAKREAAERQAFEKEKDIKRKQALMEMALGIVRIWAQSGINVIMGSILSAALAATTALNISQINAQQYAKGGRVVEELPNGKVRNRPNINQLPNGDNVLATVKTGEVVLNKQQQRKLGGDSTFRAIGVPGFASGGRVNLRESYVSAPIPESSIIRSAKKNLSNNISGDEIIDSINDKINLEVNSLKVFVSETDLSETGNIVKTTVDQSGVS